MSAAYPGGMVQTLHIDLTVSALFFSVQRPVHVFGRGDFQLIRFDEGQHTAVVGLIFQRLNAFCKFG